MHLIFILKIRNISTIKIQRLNYYHQKTWSLTVMNTKAQIISIEIKLINLLSSIKLFVKKKLSRSLTLYDNVNYIFENSLCGTDFSKPKLFLTF